MRNLYRLTWVAIFTLAATFSLVAKADQAQVSAQVRQAVEENMAATQAEDMARMMNTIHSASPSYQATQQQVAPLFQQYDLTYELKGFEFVGMTGDFAVVKVRQVTRKVGGEAAFNNNELELLQAFRKEGGQWKFWSQSILTMRFFK